MNSVLHRPLTGNNEGISMSMQAVVHLDLAKVPVNQDLPQAHSRPQVSTLEEGPLVL